MSRYLILFLAFSSILFLTSCRSYKPIQEDNHYKQKISSPLEIEVGENAVYKASIKFFRNNLSGIFVIVNADSLYKVGFVSEMGVKFFDITLCDKGFDVIYCMDALNRDAILNNLARGLRYLIENPKKHNGDVLINKNNDIAYKIKDNDGWKRIYYFENSSIKQIEGKRFWRNKVFINLNYNNKKQPENIIFLQKGIRLKIEMTKI